MWTYTNSDELYHYGVKGMKWGIRKTSYTPGGQYSTRKEKKFKREAMSILRQQSQREKAYAQIMSDKSKRDYKKADKHVWTSERAQAKGDQKKFEKYQGKAWKKLADAAISDMSAKTYLENSKILDTRISDIASDKIKAGRDYVVNKSYSIGLDIPLGNVLYVERKIDYT